MAVPRPVLLALIGLGLVASVFLVTRNASNDSVTSSSTPAAKPAVAPSAPAQARPGKGHARAAAPAKQAHAARRPAKPKAAVPKTVTPAGGVQARVLAAAQALGQDQVVVFFFSDAGAADDVGARVAGRSLRGMPRGQGLHASLDEGAAY